MKQMKPSQILRSAVDLIDERGWTRGVYENSKGCLCSVGALRQTVFGRAVRMPAHSEKEYVYIPSYDRAVEALEAEVPRHMSIVAYNDQAPDKRYVTRRMLRAAKKLEEQGR